MLLKNSTTMITELWFIPVDVLMILNTTLVIILALLFLFIIILDKACHTVSMMLIANSCVTTLISGCSMLSMRIFTIENDIKQIAYQDSLCVFRAYLVGAARAAFFYSFLLQALYRYIAVIHPTHLFWRSAKFQLLAICLTWIFAFGCIFRFLFTGDIIYNIDNQTCQLPLRLSFSVIYTICCIYIIPVHMTMLIYLKLVQYVKQMSKRVILANNLFRVQKELKMARRTIILVIILIITCFPYAFFILLSFFNNVPKYHFRIAFLFIESSLLVVMIILFQFTKPLKTSVMKIIRMLW
jgi:hypothetical protein